MTAKSIDDRLNKLKGELKKKKVMVYLANDTYADFKALCARKEFSMNEVITELVREYMASAKEPAKKK